MKTLSFVLAILFAATSALAGDCSSQVRVQLQAAPVVVQQPFLMQPFLMQHHVAVQAPVVVQQQAAVVHQPVVVQQQAAVVHQPAVVQQFVAPYVVQQPVFVQQHSVRQVAPLFQRSFNRVLPQRSTQRIVVRSSVR